MNKAKIDRINELARLSKSRELTHDEKQEQNALRAEYIAEIRKSFGNTLEHTYIQRPDGTKTKIEKKSK